ncbi:Imm45 family immunity protein [Ornithobacterium rhinotracheale]
MIRLVEYNEDFLYRGSVIKFAGKNETAFVMVCEVLGSYDLQIIRIDGYKAGIPVKTFCGESMQGCGISIKWLIENYEKWFYIDCGINNIYILPELNLNKFINNN